MRKILVIIVIALAPMILKSQGGSNYSVFGIGELVNGFGSAYDAMGGTSIAVPFNSSMTNKNPAQWNFLNTSRIQTGYTFTQNQVNDANRSLWQNNGEINGVMLNFCLDTARGINLNTGFSSYTGVNFFVSNPVEVDLSGTKLKGTTVYQGNGGITQAWIGGSYRPFDFLSLGASIFTLFGNSKKSASTLLETINSVPSRTYLSDVYGGFGIRLGLIAEPVKDLYIGSYIENKSKLDINRSLVYQSAYYSDSTINIDLVTEMPFLWGAGFSYRISNLVIAADYTTQDFSKLTYNSGTAKFTKSENISFGIARLGLFGYKRNFLDRVTYMFGLGYKSNYIEINNTAIKEYYFSLGVTAPLVGLASIDASLTFGKRGTTEKGLLRENYGRLNVSVSLGDVWFQPFRREY
jgi:hypothetical protein